MAASPGIQALAQRANALRESLQRSEAITGRVTAILGSFDHRLSLLDDAMRPIQERTQLIRSAHENIDKTLRSAGSILNQFDHVQEAESEILIGPGDDIQSYVDAVDRLRTVEAFFSSNRSYKSSEGVLNQVSDLLSKAFLKMESEFQKKIFEHSKPVEPDHLFDCLPSSLRPPSETQGDQPDSNRNHQPGHHAENQPNGELAVYNPPILIHPRIVHRLSKLAHQLVLAGRQQQCLKIYREARCSALESSLRLLGVEKLSREDVQKMQWEHLEAKIGNWIHYMRIAVKLLFASERQLCDQIFQTSESLRNECFSVVTGNSMVTLLSFGDAIAKSKRSPEKLFVLLDMYEIMCELQSEIEAIFVGEPCSKMRDSAVSLTNFLAQTTKKTFTDFVEAVEKDATKTTVADGTVHPLTSYVINYVKFLYDYQSTLKQLFQDFGNSDEASSQLASVTMSIMQALQSNLDAKSKQYRDPALMHLFLMNNIHYIVKSVRRSDAKDLLGDDWIQRHRRIVQQNANQYRRVSWTKVLQCLSTQGMSSSGSASSGGGSDGQNSGGASIVVFKERFRSFNVYFEEIYQRQCAWAVPDPELRESLRLAVAEVLLPAYRAFLKAFERHYKPTKNPSKYMKYSAEELEQLLSNLFEGRPPKDLKL